MTEDTATHEIDKLKLILEEKNRLLQPLVSSQKLLAVLAMATADAGPQAQVPAPRGQGLRKANLRFEHLQAELRVAEQDAADLVEAIYRAKAFLEERVSKFLSDKGYAVVDPNRCPAAYWHELYQKFAPLQVGATTSVDVGRTSSNVEAPDEMILRKRSWRGKKAKATDAVMAMEQEAGEGFLVDDTFAEADAVVTQDKASIDSVVSISDGCHSAAAAAVEGRAKSNNEVVRYPLIPELNPGECVCEGAVVRLGCLPGLEDFEGQCGVVAGRRGDEN